MRSFDCIYHQDKAKKFPLDQTQCWKGLPSSGCETNINCRYCDYTFAPAAESHKNRTKHILLKFEVSLCGQCQYCCASWDQKTPPTFTCGHPNGNNRKTTTWDIPEWCPLEDNEVWGETGEVE
jgi:hypothetical protein